MRKRPHTGSLPALCNLFCEAKIYSGSLICALGVVVYTWACLYLWPLFVRRAHAALSSTVYTVLELLHFDPTFARPSIVFPCSCMFCPEHVVSMSSSDAPRVLLVCCLVLLVWRPLFFLPGGKGILILKMRCVHLFSRVICDAKHE